MTGFEVILAALAAGAGVGVKDMASKAVVDAYRACPNLVSAGG
ncbi:MAG TPA: hypothetical protein VFM55_15360 [Micromonosporaceae bacterium]|nr:hypothetical protein [Micromonosporaceae bacterium]